jgi:hypothetical protein
MIKTTPQNLLEGLLHLERNDSAYPEWLAAPIIKNGSQTIQDYFSLTDGIGGSYLEQKIWSILGLPNTSRLYEYYKAIKSLSHRIIKFASGLWLIHHQHSKNSKRHAQKLVSESD